MLQITGSSTCTTIDSVCKRSVRFSSLYWLNFIVSAYEHVNPCTTPTFRRNGTTRTGDILRCAIRAACATAAAMIAPTPVETPLFSQSYAPGSGKAFIDTSRNLREVSARPK